MMTLHEPYSQCSTSATKPQIPRLARKGEVELCLPPAFMRGAGEPDERSRIPGEDRPIERTMVGIMGGHWHRTGTPGKVLVDSSKTRRTTAYGRQDDLSRSSCALLTLAPAGVRP